MNTTLNRYFRQNIAVLCICFLIATISKSQDISYVVHTEGKDGLANRKVDFVTRSENGEFYIITDRTIQEFNGSELREMDSIPHDFASNKIQFIYRDSLNNPTLVMQNTPSISVNARENQLNFISNTSHHIESETSSDSILLTGNLRQLFYLQKQKKDTYSVKLQGKIIGSFTTNTFPNQFFYDDKSEAFFAVSGKSTIEVFQKDQVKQFQGKLLWKNNKIIYCSKEGIYEWQGDEFIKKETFNQNSNDILWAKADSKGNILVALHVNFAKINTLYLWTQKEELIEYNEIIKLNNNIIDIYAEDFQDKMLLATFNGLFAVKLANKGIKKYWYTPNLPKSNFGAVVTGIVQGKDASYFVKETGGLYELKEDIYRPLVADNKLINNSGLLYYESKNELIISSYTFTDSGILTIYNVNDKRVRKKIPLNFMPLQISWLNKDQILICGKASNATFSQIKINGRAIIYDIREEIYKELILPKDIIVNEIRSILYDKIHEKYWIGTSEGLYIHQGERTEKLIDSHIRISKIIDKNVFIGSKGDGLYIFDRKNESLIKRSTSSYELTDNSIISLEIDANENIWLGSFNGISVFDQSLNLIKRIYEDEGLSNPEFNTNASAINEKGEILLGSINGLTKINPSKILDKQDIVNLNITDIEVWYNGKSKRSAYYPNFLLKKPIDSIIGHYKTTDYFVPFHSLRSSDFKIETSPTLELALSDNQFRIKKFEVGENKIKLLARNNSFQFEGEHILQFIVKPNLRPIYISLLSLLLIGLVFLIFREQKKNSEATLTEEKVKFSKQLAEMELTALRSQMNPHFIFNALGAIQYFINTKDIAKADEYLSKFAKLMRFILESSKSKFIKIEDEISMLKLYISLEHIRFEEKFSYEFHVDEELNEVEFYIPSMIIQPIVENAINHGLYHLDERKGKLSLVFEYKNEAEVHCTITDNGIGREAATNFRKEKEHTSRGIQIIKERIKALKASGLYDLEIDYTDLSTPTTGTEVSIKIYQKN